MGDGKHGADADFSIFGDNNGTAGEHKSAVCKHDIDSLFGCGHTIGVTGVDARLCCIGGITVVAFINVNSGISSFTTGLIGTIALLTIGAANGDSADDDGDASTGLMHDEVVIEVVGVDVINGGIGKVKNCSGDEQRLLLKGDCCTSFGVVAIVVYCVVGVVGMLDNVCK